MTAATTRSPSRILRLLRIEAFKMRRQRLAMAAVAAPAILAAIVPPALRLGGRSETDGFLALATALELSILLASFLLLLHAASSISAERGDGTLRDLLAAPVRRREIVLSRWLALLLEAILAVLLVAGAALAASAAAFRFEDIRAEAIEPLFYAEELREHSLRGVLYSLPPAAALVSLGLLVSVVARGAAAAAALAAGMLVVLDIAKSVLPPGSAAGRWLFNAYLPTLFDRTSYLHGLAALSGGVGDVLWIDGSPEHILGIAAPVAWAIACVAVAIAVFSRKDFAE